MHYAYKFHEKMMIKFLFQIASCYPDWVHSEHALVSDFILVSHSFLIPFPSKQTGTSCMESTL